MKTPILLFLLCEFLIFFCIKNEVKAHSFAPILFEIKKTSNNFQVLWKAPLANKEFLRPSFPKECVRKNFKSSIKKNAWIQNFTLNCPANTLVGRKVGVEGLEKSNRNILLDFQGENNYSFQELLNFKKNQIQIPKMRPNRDIIAQYFITGMKHFFGGLDHILFVLALTILITQTKRLIQSITFFTLGHSVTLYLATIRFNPLPSTIVEILIAFSILVLASEILGKNQNNGLISKYPWSMTFIFGLFHGLGFSGALINLIPSLKNLPLILLSFNFGIELAQILVVFCSLILAKSIVKLKIPIPKNIRAFYAYGIGSLGGYFFIERIFIY